MRETKLDDLARSDASTSGGARAQPRHSTRSSAAGKPAIATREPASNLPTLKALISNHRTLLADVRRSNQLLENDNTRMERELAIRREIVPTSAGWDENAAIAVSSANAKLVWIENYIHGTLAQTLWALNARAEQLEEQVTSADRQQKNRRLLQMTHTAYDQLRELMTWLKGNAHE
jgi:hypothetical protein